jgi:hypothetical protein
MDTTMKLTNEQVNYAFTVLAMVRNEKLPISLSWKITMTMQSLEPVLRAFNAHHNALRDKYALRDKEGNLVLGLNTEGAEVPNSFQVPKEVSEEFESQLKELSSQTTEFQNLGFKLSDFPESFAISPALLTHLAPLLTP